MKRQDDLLAKYNKLEVKYAFDEGRNCDKEDYLIAVFSGVACGIIDSLFVNMPNHGTKNNSLLGEVTDQQANNILSLIADKKIVSDRKVYERLSNQGLKGENLKQRLREYGIPENFSYKNGYPDLSAKITYLENRYRVGYDQSTNDKLRGNHVNITPNNHHLKSLAHCPDLIGLCCAVLDQFTEKTSFADSGRAIRVRSV